MLNNKGVLAGVRVLDLGRFQAGPRCPLMLARLGAEVIKVEKPGGEESRSYPPLVRGESAYWVAYNSGKKSLTLNLRHEMGKDILRQLVKVSDVFLQNFQPGVIDEMGFGYEVLHELNPRIIMVNVSAYGQQGRYRDRPGYDTMGQALSGLTFLSGFPGTPPTVSTTGLIDRITSLHATVACLGALYERQFSGEGQSIDVSLAETGYTLVETQIAAYMEGGLIPERPGNKLLFAVCDAFEARDGWVYIHAPAQSVYTRLCQVIGRPEWVGDPRFATTVDRTQNRDILEEEVAKWVAGYTVQEVVEKLSLSQVPAAPMNDLPNAALDPYWQEREVLMSVPSPKAGSFLVPGKMVKFSRSEVVVGPIPAPGEHNYETLTSLLGFSAGEVDQLRDKGII